MILSPPRTVGDPCQVHVWYALILQATSLLRVPFNLEQSKWIISESGVRLHIRSKCVGTFICPRNVINNIMSIINV
mgnify:CR=1 FL=1